MNNIKQKKSILIILVLLIIIFDQLSKYFININLQNYLNNNYILFTIDYVENSGAAFNIFSGNRVFLSLISLIFSFLLIYLLFRNNQSNILLLYSYSFILGGAIGNGIDRIVRGYVIDFIKLNFIYFPVFNIADLSINIGLLIFLYDLIRNNK